MDNTITCNFYWGSHGCDLELGDHPVHVCGTPEAPCCEYDEQHARARYMLYDRDGEAPVEWDSWRAAPEGWRQ